MANVTKLVTRKNNSILRERPTEMLDKLHYIKTLYRGLSKSNFKDHCGDATKGQCLAMTAETNVFSASGEMLL